MVMCTVSTYFNTLGMETDDDDASVCDLHPLAIVGGIHSGVVYAYK